jgi:hypothetical protein
MPLARAGGKDVGDAVVSSLKSVEEEEMVTQSAFRCTDDNAISTLIGISDSGVPCYVTYKIISNTNKFHICRFFVCDLIVLNTVFKPISSYIFNCSFI